VLNAFREAAEYVEASARELERQLAYDDALAVASAPDLSAHAAHFDAMTLFGLDGVALARAPAEVTLDGRDFAFRDYFRGALELAAAGERRATLARAFRSEPYRAFEFALSAPLFDARGGPRGVLLALMSTRAAFGSFEIGRPERHEPITVVLGPRDVDRDQLGSPTAHERLFVLIHPRLERGQEVELPAAYSERLVRAFGARAAPAARLRSSRVAPIVIERYEDPLLPGEGPWLAAAAPVGHAGYIVLVQLRHADTLRANSALVARVVRHGTWLLVVIAGLCVGLLFVPKRLR
jgi:hypothetical protein